jgi:hypothetical protein
MNTFKAQSLSLILVTALAASSVAPCFANETQQSMVTKDQEAVLLQQKEKDLDRIQADLDNAHTAGQISSVLNSIVAAAETYLSLKGGINLYQGKNRENSIMQFAAAAAMLVGQLVYTKISPSRQESEREKQLEQQKADTQKLIDQLRAEANQ